MQRHNKNSKPSRANVINPFTDIPDRTEEILKQAREGYSRVLDQQRADRRDREIFKQNRILADKTAKTDEYILAIDTIINWAKRSKNKSVTIDYYDFNFEDRWVVARNLFEPFLDELKNARCFVSWQSYTGVGTRKYSFIEVDINKLAEYKTSLVRTEGEIPTVGDKLSKIELKGLEEIAEKRPVELPKNILKDALRKKFHFDDDGQKGYVLRYDGVNKAALFAANYDWTYVMHVLAFYFDQDPSYGWVHYRGICRYVFSKDYDSLSKKEQADIRDRIKTTFAAIKSKKLKPSGLDTVIIIQSGWEKIGRLGSGWYRLELRPPKETSSTSST